MRASISFISGLATIFLICEPSSARHYNSVQLSCKVHGYEVNLTPTGQPGPRIGKYIYPNQMDYVVDQIVYISDRPVRTELPISFDIPPESLSLIQDSTSLLDAFDDPAWVSIERAGAQTTVALELSRDVLLELLETLGSPTAYAFRDTLLEFQFNNSRYYPEALPLWKEAIPKQTFTSFFFTGFIGTTALETCYQLDPVGLEWPDNPEFNGLAYHLCGKCNVTLLEASSKTFAPMEASKFRK